MPSFESLARWERYEPSLGNNLELPSGQRFYLRVSAGLTVDEYFATMERLRGAGASAAGIAKALAGVVELGAEPLTVRGAKVETLEAYLELAARQLGQDLIQELITTVGRLNSVEGIRELFSARLSGGARTTRHAPETADARPGSATNPSPGPTPPVSASADGGTTTESSAQP